MKILLHICCGPCAIYCTNKLKEAGNEVSGFFYNPNIHPTTEYLKRKESLEKLSTDLDLDISYMQDCQFEDFFRKITFHEKDGRCSLCWMLRLNKTAEHAVKNGFNGFTTTLLISPYQDQEKIKDIGKDAASKHSTSFMYQDFRPGFKESHQISKEMGLYHQKYCGCIYSERERFSKISNE